MLSAVSGLVLVVAIDSLVVRVLSFYCLSFVVGKVGSIQICVVGCFLCGGRFCGSIFQVDHQ